MSGLMHKIKDAVHSDKHSEQPTGTSGPHDSRAANAMDPRVDSDRDHRAAPGSTGYTSSNNYTTGTTGSSGLTGNKPVTGYDDPVGTHGPHNSRVANAADPRVDSDRDGRGVTGHHGTSGVTGGSGLTGNKPVTGYDDPTGTHGLHNSRVANAMDPRVDSDADHRRAPGTTSALTGNHGTSGGMTGTHGASGLTGSGNNYTTSGSSGLTGSSNSAYTTTGGGAPGPAPRTAGPHPSDAMNKLDPRVDSDMDHNKLAGNKVA